MSGVKWLIETQTTSVENTEALLRAIEGQGMEYATVPWRPFVDEPPGVFGPNDCVVFVGSLKLSEVIARKTSWVPGTFNTIETYRCSHYYPIVGDHLFNQPYIMLPVGELVRRKEFLLRTLSSFSSAVFVRPDSGSKLWNGRVFNARNWAEDIAAWVTKWEDVLPHEIAVASPVRTVVREWRMIIVRGRGIVTGSQYGPIILPGLPDEVRQFGEMVIADTGLDPDPAWVLDVCSDAKGDLAVMEVGGFSSAGFYACDRDVIVEAVSAAALRQWKEVHQ